MHSYIGIDIGTSSAKFVLIDGVGRILARAEEAYAIARPRPGWAEINPETWYGAVESGLSALLSGADRSRVRGIGVTGQMHTVVLLDASGASIRPALLWNDARTGDRIPALKEQIREHPEIAYIAGIVSTGSPAANLLWLRENEPENFQRLRRFLIGPDYIVYRLTGEAGTDYCEASTSSLYDIVGRAWSPAMRELIGLPASVYPVVRGSAETAGLLLPAPAEKFGLPRDTRVIVGTGDNVASSIATGCLAGDFPVLSLGTSGVVTARREWPDFEAKGKNILYSPDASHFDVLVQGVIQSCGSDYSWWNRDILGCGDFADGTLGIDADMPVDERLLFYPHLCGDKTLYADPHLRGAFFGLGTDTTRQAMTFAVLGGLCFAVRQLTEEMRFPREYLRRLRVIGGGAQSDAWMQTLADVLDTRVERAAESAGAVYGAALLCAHACGDIASLSAIGKDAAPGAVFQPRTQRAALYEKKYARYRRVYRALREVNAP